MSPYVRPYLCSHAGKTGYESAWNPTRLACMARIPRKLLAGHCYHVINRGNQRATVFHRPPDYDAFVEIIAEAQQRIRLQLLAVCLMPNHFHLVLRPVGCNDLSRWMHWLLTTHVARYRRVYGVEGRTWQGRFKAFPIQQDAHLLAVMRYVERNALRAGLVAKAEDWPWGSLRWRCEGRGPIEIDDPPAGLPRAWVALVNEPQTSVELEALRSCVNRQRPFGDSRWVSSARQRVATASVTATPTVVARSG